MKRTIAMLLAAAMIFIGGCCSDCTIKNYEDIKVDSIQTQSDFNREQYIWETFLFPTNKTSGVK